jgi:hypothetical protein
VTAPALFYGLPETRSDLAQLAAASERLVERQIYSIDIRIGDYMFRPHQKWTITPVANAGGYPGSPYFKITIEGTDRALAATADSEVVAVPAFTGSPE